MDLLTKEQQLRLHELERLGCSLKLSEQDTLLLITPKGSTVPETLKKLLKAHEYAFIKYLQYQELLVRCPDDSSKLALLRECKDRLANVTANESETRKILEGLYTEARALNTRIAILIDLLKE